MKTLSKLAERAKTPEGVTAIRTVIRDVRLGRVDAAGARAIAEAILRDGL